MWSNYIRGNYGPFTNAINQQTIPVHCLKNWEGYGLKWMNWKNCEESFRSILYVIFRDVSIREKALGWRKVTGNMSCFWCSQRVIHSEKEIHMWTKCELANGKWCESYKSCIFRDKAPSIPPVVSRYLGGTYGTLFRSRSVCQLTKENEAVCFPKGRLTLIGIHCVIFLQTTFSQIPLWQFYILHDLKFDSVLHKHSNL
jgi:hypothetical protein